MAKLKPVVLNKPGKEHTTNIKIRLTHEGKCREIATPYYIEIKHMGSDGIIKNSYPGASSLNRALYKLLIEYNNIIADIGTEIRYMTIGDVVSKLRRHEENGASFTKFIKEKTEEIKGQGREGRWRSYATTLLNLQAFAQKEEVLFKDISLSFIQQFESYLLRDHRINTVMGYMNCVRTIFNRAIDDGVIKPELYPFRKFKIKKEQTEKRSLTVEQFKEIDKKKKNKEERWAWDLCKLSFFLLGMNFKDMLSLTKDNIKTGRIIYSRAKTGAKFSVKIEPEASYILNRYKGQKYLLNGLERYKNHTSVIVMTNLRLKNLLDGLSTYYFRHSWATMAYKLGIPKDVISEALGHKMGSAITEVYIDRDFKQVDEANRSVIDCVTK